MLPTTRVFEFGEESTCQVCKQQIVFLNVGWSHVYGNPPHEGKPDTKPKVVVEERAAFDAWKDQVQEVDDE